MMSTEEEEEEESRKYTKDGTVDCRGRPADQKKTGTWKACSFIIVHECLERLTYYGMSTNLILYFTNQLDQQSATASENMSNWAGTCFAMPMIGAYLADSYLGRYMTIAVFSTIYVIGMVLLALSATVPGMRPTCYEKDKCHATTFQSVLCFVALYMIALGSGAIKPCVSAYGADQFDDEDEVEKSLKSSFFIWFYYSINLGALAASSILVWIQVRFGWGWGFSVPAVAMVIASAFFFSGTPLYRYQKPGGSPLTRIFQVIVSSLRKHRLELPGEGFLLYEISFDRSTITGSRKLEHTNQFHFLDRAAIPGRSDYNEGAVNRWRLCTVTQVEEFKMILRLLPVLATGIIFSSVYAQMGNLFLLQAEYMDTRVGKTNFKIPEASLSTFESISVITGVIIYDRLVIPAIRRFTGHPNGLTPLQRIGVGLFVSIFTTVCAMVLEIVRLETMRKHSMYAAKEATISIFWQVPQYFILGFAEVLTHIGQLEFFYDQAPDSMRSMCSALLLVTVALGNYMSSLLVTAVMAFSTRNGGPGWISDNLNDGRLHYFFGILGVLSVLNFAVFIVVANRFTCKRTVRTLQ